MKSIDVFILFSMTLFVKDAKGRLGPESILRLLSPRNPELNKVRRIEDANGDPYAVLDTIGLVEQYGYPAEQHNLTTKDGYNIVFFRIPGSPKLPPSKGKPVVFLQHGILSSSDTYVILEPGQGLAFMLADAGYDVWLGNIRGNTYCRSNTNLSVTDKEFWDFSWHEMATIDIPSMIDYALKVSEQNTLFYVGYSMGTTISFALLSEKPEYNDKIRFVVDIAPTAYWKYNPSIVWRLLVEFAPLFKQLADSVDIYDILPQTKFYTLLVESLCVKRTPFQGLCLAGLEMLLPLVAGQPGKGFDSVTLMKMAKYFPAGASTKTLMHFQQCIKAGGLIKKYDNGPTENLKMYGTETPPFYDFAKISAPIALIYGKTDPLSVPENVIKLSELLPNLVTCEAVPADDFNHLDFIASVHITDLLNNRILELLSKY